jgi:hypothetical protein
VEKICCDIELLSADFWLITPLNEKVKNKVKYKMISSKNIEFCDLSYTPSRGIIQKSLWILNLQFKQYFNFIVMQAENQF